jgi:adenylate cyclase
VQAPLALPEKPSIAILPFDNMSSDPEQVFFAEGIAEDIITELSKFRSLFVIARNSSFSFKGQALEVREIGRRLGVRYVVEGSVRRAGNRVRITAQLIDAVDNTHLWAERYDRDLEDIFAVQDEVTHAIVTTIEPHLADTERQRARRKPPDSLDAWESYQRGLWHLFQYTQADMVEAIGFIEQALERDPNFAPAHAGLCFALYYLVLSGASDDRDGDIDRAYREGKRAVMLDAADPFAHVVLGRVHSIMGEHDSAIQSCDRAIDLNPSYAMAHFGRAHSLWMSGRPAKALESNAEALRLSPRDPTLWAFMASRSIALTLLERYDEALDWAQRALQQPNTALFGHVAKLAALGQLGRTEEAADALERMLRYRPGVTLAFVREVLPITDPECRERFEAGLRKAGMPD